MHRSLAFCIWLVFAAGVLVASWRFYAIYRRRQRWKFLMTSHQSLHIARERIVAAPEEE